MEALAYEGARLQRKARIRFPERRSLPALVFVTDPGRTPDPCAAAERLPRGAAVIFRGFGAPDAEATALRLAAVCRRRGLMLLVGADASLAARAGADGVHLPERSLREARRLRARHPRWIVTAASHSARGLAAARRAGVDAALLSPAFASRSPSAAGARPWGAVRFAVLARGARLPVYALGGVTAASARRLSAAAGIAAVEALTTAPHQPPHPEPVEGRGAAHAMRRPRPLTSSA